MEQGSQASVETGEHESGREGLSEGLNDHLLTNHTSVFHLFLAAGSIEIWSLLNLWLQWGAPAFVLIFFSLRSEAGFHYFSDTHTKSCVLANKMVFLQTDRIATDVKLYLLAQVYKKKILRKGSIKLFYLLFLVLYVCRL